jgi:hypothetical protein
MTIADNAKRDFPLLGDKSVFHLVVDLVIYAADASPYRLIPQVVILPRNTADIANIFDYSRETGRHATFHAAGHRRRISPIGLSMLGASPSDQLAASAFRSEALKDR